MDDVKKGQKSKTPQKLPELRKGLTFAFNDYDRAGKPQWTIHDASRNKFYIIGLVEFELLSKWHLGDADAVIEAVNSETALHVDHADIDRFLHFLTHHYLIKQSGYHIYERAKQQKLFKKDNWFHWLINYYLFFRIPLFHPDAFLERTKWVANLLFSRKTSYVMTVLAILALYQISMRWEEFTHTFPTIFTFEGLFFYFIAYMFCKLCHEFGHAYMCKRYGIPVPSLGIAFLVFWPVLYTDTTLSWSLNNRQRMRIALAGIQVETYVTIFAALLWCNVHNLTIQAICYVTITINWIASLLINVSPFMRFDGYYVLADYLKMPNLQPRAFALTRWQIRRWLFHWPDPPPENFSPRMHHFLVAYSIVTWIYRLVIYLGIAVLVYHFFIKAIGILLFIIELYYFILGPILTEFQYWYTSREKFDFNIRTKITVVLTLSALLIFFLPIKDTITFPGTLSYAHTFLIAPEESILLSPLPKRGTEVKPNTPIIVLQSIDLDQALRKTKLEYERTLSALRRSSIDPKFESQKRILLSDLNKQRSTYQKYYSLRSRFSLSVPFNGVIADIASDITPGATVMRGQWLGDVIQPDVVQVEAFVSDLDVNSLKKGMKGYFYPENISDSSVPVKVTSIEVINATKLECQYSTELKQIKDEDTVIETPCYHVNTLGGQIATEMNEKGEFIPVDSVYRVILTAEKNPKISHVERGDVVINAKTTSFAYHFFYNFKKLWVKQSGL